MGAPWFQLQELARSHGIQAFSSNYALYADMSSRVVRVLADFTPVMEVYSIDKSFLDLGGLPDPPAEVGRRIRERVARWVGLPVCVGIATTKTLAKLANHAAKKELAGRDGVCDFGEMSPHDLDALFGRIPVSEVWGVGRQIDARLAAMGINTVQQLREASPAGIRERFSIVLERTVLELRGVPCLDIEDIVPAKQQIMASRSFGAPLFSLAQLSQAVASHTTRAAEKLRAQQCVAGAITVSVRTNPFRPRDPQYNQAVVVPLREPTSDSRVLIQAALWGLNKIYRSGYAYKKAGVLLSGLEPVARRQESLLVDKIKEGRALALMQAMDKINERWGRGSVRLLATGFGGDWRMRREKLSPAWTTQWDGLPIVLAR